jgi:hypothetical protein
MKSSVKTHEREGLKLEAAELRKELAAEHGFEP